VVPLSSTNPLLEEMLPLSRKPSAGEKKPSSSWEGFAKNPLQNR